MPYKRIITVIVLGVMVYMAFAPSVPEKVETDDNERPFNKCTQIKAVGWKAPHIKYRVFECGGVLYVSPNSGRDD